MRRFYISAEVADNLILLIASFAIVVQALRAVYFGDDTSIMPMVAIIVIVLGRRQSERKARKSSDDDKTT